jgi:hypothetical protein
MLANVLMESFVLTDIKLGDQERNRQVNSNYELCIWVAVAVGRSNAE